MRREVSESLREAFLASLRPDIVLVTSLFEGLVDDTVTSIGVFSASIPTAVILYDLIPLRHPHPYLENPEIKNWYMRKIDHLRRADLWLAISESSRREGADYLGLPGKMVVNVSAAADDHFRKIFIPLEDERRLSQKYGLSRPFLMYAGGIDYRKNMEGLISAFAHLPEDIRRTHQLAVVCSINLESRRSLDNLVQQLGLKADEVIFTGFVPEDDLVALYNLCKLFVFPSWHEGFGLPALEAMRCGAPVIASNTSSLPEVIGREDAMFDPFSEDAITAKISEVLTDNAFRKDLIRHSEEQSKKFSWDESAKRAIASFERFHGERQQKCKTIQLPARRLKLAYVSPLPPERSGIADYSAELLPELSRYYDIEVIVAPLEVSDTWIKACLPIRTIEWFIRHANRYDRVLYHFGNSPFHQHMFDLLDRFPGVVVIHDFFLGNVKEHMDRNGDVPGSWARELYKSHGYKAVGERFHVQDTDVIFKYPCNFSVLQQAVGVIVHSTYVVRLAQEWYDRSLSVDWAVINLCRAPAREADRIAVRKKLGLAPGDFVICSFGIIGTIKQNHNLLRAWLSSNLAQDSHSQLIFVGENHGGDYGRKLQDTISQSGLGDRIRITGWVDSDTYHQYLAAADMAVQLRTHSRGGTSASILDCMNYGLPTIVNANGSIADLPQDALLMLPNEFENGELIKAIEILWADAERRQKLGDRAREAILNYYAPRTCSEQYAKAIENFYACAQTGRRTLIDMLAGSENIPADERSIMALATAIATNLPFKASAHQLLVDVSEIVQRDAGTGIQRVTRSILKELLNNPPMGYRVEPIYATTDNIGYRYAREFTLRFLDCPEDCLTDDLIEAYPGDIFLGLDLQHNVVSEQLCYLESLHNHGIYVYFVVYDLLPILLPHSFQEEAETRHAKWLCDIVRFDGALCISRAVADELTEWLKTSGPKRLQSFKIGYFHLGADVENSMPSHGLPDDALQVLAKLAERPSFLMVGTVEPRKGHEQTLAVFERFWAEGLDVNLVIVGKRGWKVERLVDILCQHPEKDKRLFWLEGISDEYLERVYTNSTCLIAASEGEGFGLPLIEAAQHKLPIIARDIPIFREVAGEHAFYFSGKESADLAGAIKEWLVLYKSDRHPRSDEMPWLTWKQSTNKLLDVVLNNQWYTECK
jgi:glycosyltransferase involved in cell wall biosynthesis